MKQESRGTVTKLKGRVKEAAGILTGDRKLEQQGAQERTAGAVEEAVGKARRKAGDLVAGVARAIRK